MIEFIDAKIWEALKARLASMTGGYHIVYDSEPYPTNAATAFIVVSDFRNEAERVYIGTNDDDLYQGALQLSIMTPLSWNHTQALGVAGIIKQHFTKDLILGGLVSLTAIPSVTASYRDGPYNRIPVSIPWRALG